jgi:hypothetical protein
MTLDSNPPVVHLWRVLRVEDRTIFDQTNGPVPGKRVTYQLPDGSQSYVEIPLAQFNAEAVQQAIENSVVHILNVLDLRGPELPPSL